MALAPAAVPARAADTESGVRVPLVLQITVDGLRGDLLSRYESRLVEGGFRRLLDSGTVFANAHYSHANTETIVGHTTLATGAHPARHGMVGNVVFDREAGELSYNLEDPDAPLLPTRDDAADGSQVDPAQKRSRTAGRSPRNILVSTVADELSMHTLGQAKIFGVSGKDRSAIAMAGHAGKAFWFSTDTGDFQTSRYYYQEYPEWVATWNAKRLAEAYAGKEWRLSDDPASYLLRDHDDRPFETDLKGYGRTFPHPFGDADDKLFATRLLISPVGDRLAADFAKTLIDAEQLGADEVPDYLSVSFSGVDAVNHFFGPSSLENEAVVLELDRTLADLFAFVDERVGAGNTLIVLSADHGMPEAPEAAAAYGVTAGDVDPKAVYGAAAGATKAAFGVGGLVKAFFRPYIYLDHSKLREAGLDPADVSAAIAARVGRMDGIAVAASTYSLDALPDRRLARAIANNHHPERSGDVYVVQSPYWFLQEGGALAVMHGSPWAYDTFVPIVFAGPGIGARTVNRLVHPVAVAPTISTLLRIKPPSAAVRGPLHEVLQ
jgi:hypothetical protein